jgi:dipeptidyl aminopeptidase/acylaminoacyl peptidase
VNSFTRRGLLAAGAAPALAGAWLARADAAGSPPTIEALIQKPLVRGAALSPDGKRIAIIKQAEEGKQRQSFIELIDADDPALKRIRVPLGNLDVQSLAWGANDRFLVSVYYEVTQAGTITGSLLKANQYGLKLARTVAMGLDGGGQVVLFGKDEKILSFNYDLTMIVDLLPDDPDHVLMMAGDPHEGVWALYTVDIRTGLSHLYERGGLDTTGWWTKDGVPVLRRDAVGDGRRVEALYARLPGHADWKFLRKYRLNEVDKPDFDVLAPTEDASVFLVATMGDSDSAKAVRKWDLATGALGDLVVSHPDRDIEDCLIDSRRRLVAAAYGDDRIGYEFADASLAPHFRGISKFFGDDSNVVLADITPDHNRMLARVSSPTDRGGYYFYDRAAHRLQGLDLTHPWLASSQLAKVEMLDVKARDGQALRAYLTAPLAGGPRPLVVMPHGGPELRDTYQFDLFAQAFAAQGWLVLQPNFRGSGGYGRAFAEAGHRHWGDLMQADVEDAADQVIGSGRVDAKRVAIWGASYGGYAALMGAIRRPDFYRCAVSLAGVTDLATMLAWEKTQDPDGLIYAYEIKRIGDPKTDGALIAAGSPVTHVAAIKTPVLLMHGTKDKIVDPAQSREMAAALKSAGKTCSYVELPGAGHHLNEWDEKTRTTILQTSVDFIGKSFA